MTSEIFGHTIFSDDLRHEVGGKTSYIGVYNSVMFFSPDHSFPISVPILSLAVHLYMPTSVDRTAQS